MIKAKYKLIDEIIKPDGWLKEYLLRDAKGITGNLDKLFEDAASDVFGKGKVEHLEKNYWSSWWAGETRGNYMEAVVKLSFLCDCPEIKKKAEDFIQSVLENQDEDGYIGIYKKNHRYKITRRFGEYWTQSRVLRTLLAYYKGTRSERVYEAMIRMADNIVVSLDNADGTRRSLFEIPDEDGSKGHGLTIIDGFYELYKLTKNPKYAEFAVFLYEDYDSHASKFLQEDLRTAKLFDDSEDYIGHGPHTAEMIRLPLMLYAMTENERYLNIFIKAIEKLKNYMSISGSLKSDEFIGSFHQLYVKDEIDFKPLGCLPLPSAGYEYCSTTELLVDFQLAACILGDLSYSSKQENALINASMAAKQADGKAIQYICCDNMYDASLAVGERYDYSPTHKDAAVCCAPNACRIMPIHCDSIFLTGDEGFLINLFAPASVKTSYNGTGVNLIQLSEHGFGKTAEVRVVAAKKCNFVVEIRIPEYADCAKIFLDGRQVAFAKGNSIARIESEWSNNLVRIETEYVPHLIKAVDGTFALKYGAILYSLNIDAEREDYYRYENAPEFYDMNYYPVKHANWDYTFITDENEKLRYFNEILPDSGYFWDNPTALEVLMLDRFSIPKCVKLLPIGATILRRTTFPAIIDSKGRYKFEKLEAGATSNHESGGKN